MKIQKIKRYFRLLNRLTLRRTGNFLLNTLETKLGTKYCLSKPIETDIVLTKHCNIDCIFCIKYPTLGEKEMTVENFKKIAAELFPYCLRVRFCSGGEPLLHKNIKEFFNICQNYNLSVSLTTNGTLLNESMSNFLIKETTLNQINFSLDGATKETVESIRKGVNYDIVIKNIKTFIAIKKESKNNNITSIIRFAAMKKNISELPKLVQLAKQWGIDEIHVNYLNVANDMKESESLFYTPSITEKYFKAATKIAKENGVVLVLPPQILATPKINECSLPWKLAIIDTDCSVHFCYKSLHHPIGNIISAKNFNQVWNNPEYQQIRATNNSFQPFFNNCTNCSERVGFSCPNSHFHCKTPPIVLK